MPDTTAAPRGGLASLTRKVGPLPVWAYALIAVAGWYWYTHYGPGAKAAAAAAVPGPAPTDLADVNQQLEELRQAEGNEQQPRHRPPHTTGTYVVPAATKTPTRFTPPSLDKVSADLRTSGNPHATPAGIVTETNKHPPVPASFVAYQERHAWGRPLPHGITLYYWSGK